MPAPKILKAFNLFVDGVNFAGLVDEVTPPELTVKTEEHRAGGMNAPIAIDLGLDKLELQMTTAEHHTALYGQFGLVAGAETQVMLRGAVQEEGSNRVSAIVIHARGQIVKLASDAWKAGSKAPVKTTLACRYYRFERDGVTEIEIDPINRKRVIGGVDQEAAVRAVLGL